MNLGQLFSGAGRVATGMQEAEATARLARQNQLAIEEQNRLADLKARMAQTQMPSFQQVQLPQFNQPVMPAQQMPMETVSPAAPAAPVAVTPTRPAAQQPLPPSVQPSQAGAGRGVVNPPVVGQPQPTATISPEQAQRERDRLALLRLPTAALDVVQAPAAAGLNLFGAVATGAQNLAGRVVNAVTGEATLPTDTEYRKFSMTPFYDRYVRQPEQQLAQQTGAPTASAVPAEPPKPTKAAQQYDNKTTPYDALMAQSAQQYGIDPVIFKRLIGTESSFQVNAVSPRGASYGLGIAQIADVHGLTREQRLDPNTAIPFAAQLFSQYLQESGGNYEQAIQRYKGASSDKGKAAMSGPINTILSGITPSAQAAPAAPAAGTPPAPMEVPRTQARNMQMAEFYLANPQSIPYEQQQLQQVAQQQAALLTRQRNETAQLAQMYMQSGTSQGIEQAMRMREAIGQIDASLLQLQQQVVQKQTYLQGMQGLRELAIANDPRRLSGVLSQYMGAPVGIQPRSDGTYNYFVNGQRVKEGVSPSELASMALREFSPEARSAAAASAQLENELALKRKYGDAVVNAMRDIQKAIVEGEYKIAEERAKQAQGKLTVDSSKGVAYFQQGNRVFVINPDGKVEEIGGTKVETPPTARPVAGLNLGR